MADKSRLPHELSLRELCAELQGFRTLMEERDKRYDERDKRVDQSFRESKEAVQSALAAAKEQTGATFLASEKAIVKAEDAQRAYNQAHNDLLRKQDLLVPRLEWEGRNKSIDDKLIDLRKGFEVQLAGLDASITVLSKTLAAMEGRTGGIGVSGDIAARFVSIVIAVGAVIVSLVAVFRR
jgi:hypothetical protein